MYDHCKNCKHQDKGVAELPCMGCKRNNSNSGVDKFEPIEEPKYRSTEKYEDGFSIIDIATARSHWDLIIPIMKDDCNEDHKEKYSWENWIDDKTVQKNIPWFVKNGFIEEEIELKSCPFCGNIKDVTISSDGHMFYAECEDDEDKEGAEGCGASTRWFNTKKEAAAKWNTRI